MCGDLDEDESQIEEQFYARLRTHALALIAQHGDHA